MTASIIPAPIVQGRVLQPERQPTQSVVLAERSPAQTQQQELEADLQFLLDAQAEGLVRGLEGGSADDRSSVGSATPTADMLRSSATVRPRRAPKRKLGLRSARKGIYTTVLALSALKDEEIQELEGQRVTSAATLEQIQAWETKRRGLEEASKHAFSDEETIRVERLRQEGDALQAEIGRVELQLMELKARHRKIMSQAAAVENSMQAKLASYTSSLRLLEEDVQRFLSIEPDGQFSRPRSRDGSANIWNLPAKRRTLDMAKEYHRSQENALEKQKASIQREKSALDDGAALWQEAVKEISQFERQLRSEMAVLSPSHSGSAWEDHRQSDTNAPVRKLLSDMFTLMESLTKKLDHAEEQNWNLLIVAIGAELDALRKGKEILEGVLGSSVEGNLVDTNYHESAIHDTQAGDEIHELDHGFRTTRLGSSSDHVSDDDPDPELLFSRHDPEAE